ncbi:MAG TPA: EamA family transporter [Nitrososphaeraceae archaeon]|nr:EamA family transporter [Nitrososphaeraceae archaeon]
MKQLGLHHQQQRTKIWIILIALWVINGSSFLAIKISIDTIPPLLSSGIRFIIAGSILLSIYLVRERKNHGKNVDHIGWKQWKDTIILAALLLLGGQGLLTWGTQYLASGISGLLNSTIPLWVAILALLIFKNRMTKFMIIGLAAGFSGLMLLVAPSLGSGELSPIGTAALIVSSIFWALGSLYSTKANLPVSMLASSGMLMITGGLIITAISFALGEYRGLELSDISGQSLAALIYLIVIITIVGFTDFYWLLRVTTASLANTFAYVSPVIAVTLGALLLHEPVTVVTIIAMSVILVGVALMVTTTGKAKQEKTEGDQGKQRGHA